MREEVVARQVLEVAEEVRLQHRGTHVNAIRLAVGPLAHLDDAALRSAFLALSLGGPAEGADLWIDREPYSGVCSACGMPIQVLSVLERCPGCGEAALEWNQAAGAEVVSVEIAVQAVG